MSKTPYEIRSDLLDLANTLLVNQYYEKAAIVKSILERTLSATSISIDEIATFNAAAVNSMPTFPSAADIIAKARELYEFVNQKTVEGDK